MCYSDENCLCRYYESDEALNSHWKSKVHKRRLKELKDFVHTIEMAEWAAGLHREWKKPKATMNVDTQT